MLATNAGTWALTDEQRELLERWLVAFEQGWDEDRLAARVRELPPDGSLRLAALVEMAKIDLERNWQRGRRVAIESYLRDYPELGTSETVPADLLLTEFESRRRLGEEGAFDALSGRFPRRADDLRRLVEQGSGTSPSVTPSTVGRPLGSLALDVAATEADLAGLSGRFGRYEIVRRLGQGGMGSVYLAHDTQLDRPVALKIPRFAIDDGAGAHERFYREARAAAALRHPNLCPVFDVDHIEGTHYLTMAYIEGQTLADRLKAGPPFPPREAVALVRRLAAALEVAHGHGVIHRDLKPANVILGRDGEPVITDFGLARRSGKGDALLTQSGSVLGTPAYMSPEQARGDSAAVGPASDVYSLGVMLYELLTGRRPFTGTLTEVLWQITSREPERPATLRPDLDPRLEEIVMRAMAKQVSDRYGSAGELGSALSDYLDHEQSVPAPRNRVADYLERTTPEAATPKGTTAGAGRKGPGWRRSSVLAAAFIGGLALLAAVIVIRYRGNDGKEKTLEIPDAAPGSKVVVETPNGKKLAEARVPPNSTERPRAGKGPMVIVPERRPTDWDVSPDGATTALAHGEIVELWDARTGRSRRTEQAASRNARSVRFSLDSRYLAVGSYRRVKLWDLLGKREPVEFKDPKDDVVFLDFLRDGGRLAAIDRSGTAWLWDVATGEVVKTVNLGREIAQGPLFSTPNVPFVLSDGGGGVVDQDLIDLETLGAKRISVIRHRQMTDAAFFADERRLVLGEADEVTLYDLDRKKAEEVHHLHTAEVVRVEPSPDGKLVASGSKDKTAVIWDLEAGKEKATLKGFDGPVRVRFSPDGKTLAAWSENGPVVRRRDVAGGKELPPLLGHAEGVSWVTFRRNGQLLIVAERDGRMTFYDAESFPK